MQWDNNATHTYDLLEINFKPYHEDVDKNSYQAILYSEELLMQIARGSLYEEQLNGRPW